MKLWMTASFTSCYFDFLIASLSHVFIYIYAPLYFPRLPSSYVSCLPHWHNSCFKGNCSCVLLAAFFLIIPPISFSHAHVIVSPEDGGFSLLGNVYVLCYFKFKMPCNWRCTPLLKAEFQGKKFLQAKHFTLCEIYHWYSEGTCSLRKMRLLKQSKNNTLNLRRTPIFGSKCLKNCASYVRSNMVYLQNCVVSHMTIVLTLTAVRAQISWTYIPVFRERMDRK